MNTDGARRRSVWIWLGYWVALFVLTHTPTSGLPGPRIEHADKVIHFALYFLLTWLGNRAATSTPRAVSVLFRWALAYAIFAALDEWSQTLVGRTPSLMDWFADLAGVTAATVWWWARSMRNASSRLGRQNADL